MASMGTLRALWRTVVLLFITVFYYAELVLGETIARCLRKPAEDWQSRIVRNWAQSVGRLIGMHTQVIGTPPTAPFVLVSNHLSYIDVVLLLGHCPNATFIAKRDVETWPFIGFLARRVGTLFIDRESRRDLLRINTAIARCLDARRGLVLFAEGTTTKGLQVNPLKPSLLAEPASRALPTAYCTITYRTDQDQPPAHQLVCWWDDSPFAQHAFTLFKTPRFDAQLNFGGPPILARDRKALATKLHAALANQFDPVVTEEEACRNKEA